jgi:hypothetical protein
MKPKATVVALFVLLSSGAAAQDISGVLDTQLFLGAGTEEGRRFSWGLEEAANVRLQAKLRDGASFYSAVNFIAAAGSFAQNATGMAALGKAAANANGSGSDLAPGTFVAGENYLGALELERLYFRISGDYTGFDAGLMRLAFGYGQVWGSSDFLNPRNPLLPNARPRAVLGAAFAAYPLEDAKFQLFGAGPRNPFNADGGGAIFGLSAENHWKTMSAQFLYAYETPQENYVTAAGLAAVAAGSAVSPDENTGSEYGVHRWGLSLKADVEIGLVADILFAWNPDRDIGVEGLSAGAGFDYSFADGKCYALLEYLFSGLESSTSKAANPLTGFSNRNYLYALFRYRFNDYTSAGLGCIASFDDVSFTPTASFEHELLQGMNLTLTVQAPLDRDSFGGGGEGELGPAKSGNYVTVTTLLRLRF